ncbi:MAG TPA: hypothetical protein VK742_01600 [Candidatus Sulfotelmatobacter sp.]|nr:hypothetical protein [Candidatus Sulfotelmatobacter sp.]
MIYDTIYDLQKGGRMPPECLHQSAVVFTLPAKLIERITSGVTAKPCLYSAAG